MEGPLHLAECPAAEVQGIHGMVWPRVQGYIGRDWAQVVRRVRHDVRCSDFVDEGGCQARLNWLLCSAKECAEWLEPRFIASKNLRTSTEVARTPVQNTGYI